jgi:hypothetical protein
VGDTNVNEVVDLDAAYREMRQSPPLYEVVECGDLSYARRPNVEPAIIRLDIECFYAKRYDLWGRWGDEIYAAAERFGVKVRSVNFVTGDDLGLKQARAEDELGKINAVEVECWGATINLEPLCARLSMGDEEFLQWGIEWVDEWPSPTYRRAKIAALAKEGINIRMN